MVESSPSATQRFFGSMGAEPLVAPVTGIAPTPSGNGYWLVGRDGGVFNFGDAVFLGSSGGMGDEPPVIGIVAG